MKLECFIVILSNCIYIKGFLYDDVSTKFVEPYGKAEFRIYVKEYNMFYYTYATSYTTCWCQSSSNCDVVFFSRTCFLKSKYFGKRTPGEYNTKELYSFSIDNRYNLQLKTAILTEFNCGTVSYAEGNFADYIYSNKLLDVGFYIDKIGEIFQTTFSVGEKVSFDLLSCKFKNYYEMFFEDVHSGYIIIDTCWYSCKDSQRSSCNCRTVSNAIICNPVCKPGWMKSVVKLVQMNTNKTFSLFECNVLDKCASGPCKVNETCLFLQNSSITCETIEMRFRSGTGEIIKSDIMFFQETVFPEINPLLISYIAILPHINVVVDQNTFAFLTRRVAVKTSNKIALEFLDRTFIDIYTECQFTLDCVPWRKIFKRKFKFRIYDKPDSITYYVGSKKNATLLTEPYVYMNSLISFKNNGRPQYRILSFWSCTIEILYPFLHFQKIPITIRETEIYINVFLTMIAKNRKFTYIENYQIVYMKRLRYFRWNLDGNVLETNEKLKCEIFTYVDYEIKMTQISGYSTINIFADTATFNSLLNDLYHILCIWKQKNLPVMYTLHKIFRVASEPKDVCFLPFPRIQGIIVQCAHPGTPADEYITSVDFFVLKNGKSTGRKINTNHIRIPYIVASKEFVVICTVLSIKRKIKTTTKRFTNFLSEDFKDVLSLTKFDLRCLQYENYVEALPIYKFVDKNMFFKIPQFILKYDFIFISNLLIPLLFLIFFCFAYGLHACYQSNVNKMRSARNVNLTRKILKRNAMIQNVEKQCRTAMFRVNVNMPHNFFSGMLSSKISEI